MSAQRANAAGGGALRREVGTAVLSCDIQAMDFLADTRSEGIICNIELIVHLQAQPETGGITEVS